MTKLLSRKVRADILYRFYSSSQLPTIFNSENSNNSVRLTWTTLITQQSERGKVRTMRTMEMIMSMWAHQPWPSSQAEYQRSEQIRSEQSRDSPIFSWLWLREPRRLSPSPFLWFCFVDIALNSLISVRQSELREHSEA